MALIEIKNLCKLYDENINIKALNNVTFSIEKGEFIAIMGASGCGKTTLLNLISTIDNKTSGKLKINNIEIENLKEKELAQFRKNNLGFIFQNLNLLDTLTLFENIEIVLNINKKNNKENLDRIKNLAKLLEIEEILYKYPYEVSGGQKQRCACLRALINEPKIIFADEPTGVLDSSSKNDFMKILSKVNKDMGTTIFLVTHDPVVASYSNRILFLKDGQIFNEIKKENSRKEFYKNILEITNELDEIDD